MIEFITPSNIRKKLEKYTHDINTIEESKNNINNQIT